MFDLGTRRTISGSIASHVAANSAPFPPHDVIFGKSPRMAALSKAISKVAATVVPVLITGETGTGKELIARILHRDSLVGSGPFIQVNCAAIPATLLESELFGFEKGAFTGALEARPGRVELATSGTLFLDEIGELGTASQAKLLQVLQDARFSRIGGQEEKNVKVRFIFATNLNLTKEMASGNFREDLFYRINVVNLHLPPLRERVEDIPALCEYFIARHNEKFGSCAGPLSDNCIRSLQEYHWPGNIRQLENLTKRYAILGSEDAIFSELHERESDIFDFVIPPQGELSLKQITGRAVRQVERKVILKVVEASNWNRKRAAKRLNISYRALLYKLKEVGVPSTRRRAQNTRKLQPDPAPERSLPSWEGQAKEL